MSRNGLKSGFTGHMVFNCSTWSPVFTPIMMFLCGVIAKITIALKIIAIV